MLRTPDPADHRPVVAVYGGSFNPPHLGHALVATALHLRADVDEVWWVPVYQHAFQDIQPKRLAPYRRRVAWCEGLAQRLGPWAQVSQAEADLPPPSYTIDTLRYFESEYPNKQFRLVVGADVLNDTAGWQRWDRIEAEFSPIVVGRQGYTRPLPEPSLDFPAVSSTALRAALRRGAAVGHWLPAVVEAELKANGLPAEWSSEG